MGAAKAQGNSAGLILGVDPGLSGALAWLDRESGCLLQVEDMPTCAAPKRADGTYKRTVDVQNLGLLIDYRALNTAYAVVEDVHSMPGQGVASMFTFGKATGAIHGVLGAYMIPFHLIKPSVWKCQMGLSVDKRLSLDMAIRLFPDRRDLFAAKKHDGRAEAALLAWFGFKRLGAIYGSHACG